LNKRLTLSVVAAAALLTAGASGVVVHKSWAQGVGETVKVATRRMTESQYRQAISQAFGPGILINSRFEPEKREDGLLAVGVAQLSVTSSGFEQYFALAQNISGQVLDPAKRAALVPCQPASATAADNACTEQFVRKYGDILFRRPLTQGEVAARVTAASAAATKSGDFYQGLRVALASMLAAPEFLFRVETAERDPAKPNGWRLDGYTKAARLSFLFWDSPPDAELMAAARSGDLHTPEGLKKQVDRLSASPRLQGGARAFFTDMLQLDQFESLNKDAATYPKFSQAVADSAREETLKTITNLLVGQKGDYRDIFTSRQTFINRPLAAVYQVPFNSTEPWVTHTFPETSERSGILTEVTFLSLFSHPGRSSPTKRGVKLNEIFLCEPTPDPPADVDFSKVQAIENGTVRTRLLAHMTNEGCAACHRVSDPPGLALEHFDGLGQLRTLENGTPIDVGAQIGAKRIVGARDLGVLMHDNPKVPVCLVRNVYTYGIGHRSDDRDQDYIEDQTKAFAAGGYRLGSLMAQISTSPEFFKVSVPRGALTPQPAKVASANSTSVHGGVQ
jgi:hypothetical protein